MPKKADAKYRILVVDDDDDILALLRTWLGNEGFEVLTCSSGEDALGQLHTTNPNLVITDLFMGGMSGMELLSIIHRDNPLLPVIMLSGQAKIPDAVKATHLGSSAFLTKPINKEELFDQVKRALRLSSDTRAEQVRPKQGDDIIYRSKAMAEIVDLAELVGDSNVTVFISGATGTGKEVIAKAIHEFSNRRSHPFIAVNCGAVPEQLLESELFGHEKGAFTGASAKHDGLFQAANNGTLFLDEIGDMPISLQVKLLRVLQDFEVRPVGSTRSYPVDVRIISATHQDLDLAVKEGEFREDLYYRLKVLPIEMPSLSERREDIPLLATHFLQKRAVQNNDKAKHFAPDAMDYLMTGAWQGNIRQLINVVELCVTLTKTETIPLSLVQKALQNQPAPLQTLKDAKQEFERNYLISVLRVSQGQVANAARIAGRNRTEFYKLLNQHNINPVDFRTDKEDLITE
ncbi:MAG: two-component system response regulator GlrR [Planctomycetota bacterium]|jgi:two-component system response regulator GlrR